MAADIPKDPKDLAQEDKDALDLLASEAKEFEKASNHLTYNQASCHATAEVDASSAHVLFSFIHIWTCRHNN